jgi:hypothetical protein
MNLKVCIFQSTKCAFVLQRICCQHAPHKNMQVALLKARFKYAYLHKYYVFP